MIIKAAMMIYIGQIDEGQDDAFEEYLNCGFDQSGYDLVIEYSYNQFFIDQELSFIQAHPLF